MNPYVLHGAVRTTPRRAVADVGVPHDARCLGLPAQTLLSGAWGTVAPLAWEPGLDEDPVGGRDTDLLGPQAAFGDQGAQDQTA